MHVIQFMLHLVLCMLCKNCAHIGLTVVVVVYYFPFDQVFFLLWRIFP